MPTNPSLPEPAHSLSASDVKRQGWRGVMRIVQKHGTVVVTNHHRAEAVILDVQEYEALRTLVRQTEGRIESELEELRHRFDERLKALRATDAGKRLKSVVRGAVRLHGKVKAGTGY